MIKLFKRIYTRRRLSQLLILVSFLITFILIRTITYLQKLAILPNQTWDVHIHHLVPGIFLLIIGGYLGISFWSYPTVQHTMAVIFGIGAALTIDEMALWLYLHDVYWEKEGRLSIDAIIVTTVLLSLGYLLSEVYDHHWWIFKKKHEK